MLYREFPYRTNNPFPNCIISILTLISPYIWIICLGSTLKNHKFHFITFDIIFWDKCCTQQIQKLVIIAFSSALDSAQGNCVLE
jgi:hypothetical protein